MRKLLGRNDIEDALRKLDTLTTEEARMAIAENLNVTHSMDNKVTVLMETGQETLKVTNTVDDKITALIDGGQDVFSLAIYVFLIMDMAICERY